LLGAAPVPPSGDRIAFDIVRRGDRIGSHILTFDRVPGGFDVHIAVDIAVGIGPLILFRYKLRGVEQWREGLVTHVDATTNHDGAPNWMRADRSSGGLVVSGSKAQPYVAPADALPATHWNVAELAGPWINPEDGRLFRPRVTEKGVDLFRLGDGRSVPADHFVLSGEVRLDIWYDDAKRWTGLGFNAGDGSAIRYEPV
jgi:hypothetical protein